ncbi:hypothetical protein M404DRAFT_1000540 [Pisolithus tinctorius Marx 270]|uniref:Uncharacterized protein n=1 Tax=Pisolithus tinctorius Marx 270 TaxID=870435 RepID=A0A0C3P9D5_PISTI|nr:hypothetical protein M404DRAFT_1000540 [Pisolithus tinctorius Marx 270]
MWPRPIALTPSFTLALADSNRFIHTFERWFHTSPVICPQLDALSHSKALMFIFDQ